MPQLYLDMDGVLAESKDAEEAALISRMSKALDGMRLFDLHNPQARAEAYPIDVTLSAMAAFSFCHCDNAALTAQLARRRVLEQKP